MGILRKAGHGYGYTLPDTGILRNEDTLFQAQICMKTLPSSQFLFFLKPYRPNIMPSFRGVKTDHEKGWKQIYMHTDMARQAIYK